MAHWLPPQAADAKALSAFILSVSTLLEVQHQHLLTSLSPAVQSYPDVSCFVFFGETEHGAGDGCSPFEYQTVIKFILGCFLV